MPYWTRATGEGWERQRESAVTCGEGIRKRGSGGGLGLAGAGDGKGKGRRGNTRREGSVEVVVAIVLKIGLIG